MKKVILTEAALLVLLAGVMALLLMKKETKDVSMESVEAAFTAECAFNQMEKAGDMRMKRAFALNAEDFDGYFYYAPNNTMSVDEFLVVKLRDESQADEVMAAFDARLETQKRNFDGYGVDQTDLLNQATIMNEGRYILFAVGKESGNWVEIVRKVWEK